MDYIDGNNDHHLKVTKNHLEHNKEHPTYSFDHGCFNCWPCPCTHEACSRPPFQMASGTVFRTMPEHGTVVFTQIKCDRLWRPSSVLRSGHGHLMSKNIWSNKRCLPLKKTQFVKYEEYGSTWSWRYKEQPSESSLVSELWDTRKTFSSLSRVWHFSLWGGIKTCCWNLEEFPILMKIWMSFVSITQLIEHKNCISLYSYHILFLPLL